MKFLDKVKNMFIDYDDEEEIKKEVIKVKIPTPERKKEEKVTHEYEPNPKYDEDYERPTKEIEIEKEEHEEKKQVEKKQDVAPEPKNFVPKYFDDHDFEMLDDKKEPDIVKQEYKYTRTETVIKPSISGYGMKKEESKKNFTPTPIISPVYGILDKNYKKEEISPKKKSTTTIYSQFDKVDVDDIRKKAYGTLEDDLEKNLTSRDAIIFNDEIDIKIEDDKEITDYEEQPLDIFKELEKKDALDDLLESYDLKEDNYEEEEPLKQDSLVEDALNRDYDNYEEELNDSYKEELNDSDLFNLIDSMYNNKEEGE